MSRTTGPILAVGAITIANAVLLNGKPWDWRVPIATGVAAGMFALAERAWEPGAVGFAYIALVTTLFVPLDQRAPAPVQSAQAWFSGGAPAPAGRAVWT